MQKADSAAVLDHLWVHAFLCGYRGGHNGPRQLQALGLSAEALVGDLGNPSPPGDGKLQLRVSPPWLRQVLRSFFAWRRRNICVTWGCSPGQMVRLLLSTKEGEGMPRFAWTTKGQASSKA